MSRTPFDVVVTNPRNDSFSNEDHMTVINPTLEIYNACKNQTGDKSHLLTREIGDDSLWLENTRTIASEHFEVEEELMINYRNIYYNYPSLPSSVPFYRHSDRAYYIISKDKPVTIPNGTVLFSANNGVHINPLDPLTSGYQIQPGTMQVCCEDYFARPIGNQSNVFQKSKSVSEISLFPNPTIGNLVTIRYRFADNAPVEANIYSLQGALIYKFSMPFADNRKESYYPVDLSKFNLAPGMYLIRLENRRESLSEKFIIKP